MLDSLHLLSCDYVLWYHIHVIKINLLGSFSQGILVLHIEKQHAPSEQKIGHQPANMPTRYWLTPSGVKLPTSEKTREIKSGLEIFSGMQIRSEGMYYWPCIVYVRVRSGDLILGNLYRIRMIARDESRRIVIGISGMTTRGRKVCQKWEWERKNSWVMTWKVVLWQGEKTVELITGKFSQSPTRIGYQN